MASLSKKIMMLHNVLWSHYKAAVFSEFQKILNKNNMELFVLQIAVTENQRKALGEIDISYHKYPYKLLFRSSFEAIPFLKKVITIAKETFLNDYDVIVIPGYADIAYCIALLVSKGKGKKIIVSFDSTEMDHPRVWYKEVLKKLFISACHASFCYGRKSKEYLIKLGMAPNNIYTRCQATCNDEVEKSCASAAKNRGMLLQRYGFKHYNFIYVGRLSKEKNLETLLSAFHKVKKENITSMNWGLILVGDGSERQCLQQEVSVSRIPDVFFVGGKSSKEVPTYYALSNVLILPSLSEPWGLVVNEAMICGLPVLVSKQCGAAYDLVQEGENGFAFDPYDAKQLASFMNRFVRQEVDMIRMGQKSKEIIAGYTPEHAADQMFKAIKVVLENK